MKAPTLSLALILVGTTGVLADDMKMPVNASQLEWAQAPNFVQGAQIAVLSGDPSKDGPYVIRFRCLPDTRSHRFLTQDPPIGTPPNNGRVRIRI